MHGWMHGWIDRRERVKAAEDGMGWDGEGLLDIHDHGYACQHPLSRTSSCLQLGAEHEGGASELCLVGGTDVDALRSVHLIRCHCLNIDDRHATEHLFRL